jgi:hypothetical protein
MRPQFARPVARNRDGRLAAGLAVVTVAMLAGCAAAPPMSSFAGRTPAFAPERFFLGDTRSTGVEETADGAPSRRFSVSSHGAALADGGFRLDQTIAYEGDQPRIRTWALSRQGDHRYRGTLTDADGPVSAEAEGDLFHLTYPIKGVPLGSMEQWLYLQPDGCTVINEGAVRLAGLTIRRISERISKVSC